MKTNFSVETSLPAYHENQSGKQIQAQKILTQIKLGANNLKALENIMGIPQGTISGRISDLIVDDKVKYDGFVFFENRKRKRIVLVSEVIIEPNGQLAIV